MIPVAKPKMGLRERLAVDRVLRSGKLAQGHEVQAFESEFNSYIGSLESVAVNSGTSALHLSLLALGIGKGDEVMVPSFSFAATANAVALTGATPVFVDIEDVFFNMDPKKIEEKINSRTKAIMPVHLYGHPADMVQISSIADKHGLIVVEDAAQAHGASIGGKMVGSWGQAAGFSFYPTKNMTSGEGGMVTVSSIDIARNIRMLRNQGMEVRYQNEIVGFNNRMTDIHASIGRVQLKRLPEWTRQRQKNAKFLSENLRGVIVPRIGENASHVFHQYTIQVVALDRDEFANQLERNGVGSGVYYPTPIHKLPTFIGGADLPVTEEVSKRALSLPVHPSLKPRDLEKIVKTVNKIARAGT